MRQTPAPGPPLRVAYVPGVTLTKWRRVWDERFRQPLDVVPVALDEARRTLLSKEVDACFLRLPVDRTDLHAIPLYEEVVVAWMAKDHPVTVLDEVTMADLADETVLTEADDVAISRALAGAVLLVPMSIARSGSRRDLVSCPVVDAPPSPVALAWRVDDDNPLIEELVGVVRGRTPNSSRTARERAAQQDDQGRRRVPRGGRRR